MAKSALNILYLDCLDIYIQSMQEPFRDVDSFFNETDLQQLHDDAKAKSWLKVHIFNIFFGNKQTTKFFKF